MTDEIKKQKDYFGLTAGLSGTQIKIIAVIMMVFDHLYQIFHVHGIPQWFNWIGRPVAPVFLFICAEGFIHTRSRKRYLLQLLIGFELMQIISSVLTFALPNDDVILMFSIFGSLFFTVLYMLFIDMLCAGIKTRNAGKAALAVLLMILPLAYGYVTTSFLLSSEIAIPGWLLLAVFQFIPNIMTVEGSFFWPLIGSLFYILRRQRILQILPPVVFGIVFFVLGSIEWLIIFAAVFVLLYNGSRGKGSKYFFYIFYPAHIYVFYVIAYFLQR